jgi:very-short-patch-repair endonuclease
MLPYNRQLKAKARSLRANPTDAELHLWHRLRRKQIHEVLLQTGAVLESIFQAMKIPPNLPLPKGGTVHGRVIP